MKTFTPVLLFIALATNVFADAQITSWYTGYSGQYVRAYTNTSMRTSGTTVTTWAKQSVPVYADVPFVASSASWVYVEAADLPSYVIGPWLNPNYQPGTLYPTNQHALNRIPRAPAVQAGTKDTTSTGASGLWANGVNIFNFTDGKAWDPTNLTVVSGPHIKPSYYWHRNAPSTWAEKTNFDYALGHQIPSGAYHTHQQAIALRYQLGDHIDYNTSTKNYSESASTPTSHSPILGWSYDGYPIYGPYGYSVSNDASSGIRRMVSGYVLRDGQNGTDNLTNNLTTIPAWYARFRVNHFGGTYTVTTSQSRPPVAGTNVIGTYAQDYAYYGDVTNPATSKPYVMGTNTFDLDEYNVRYCVTPEYPQGTYAYFIDIDASGNSTYPYTFAFEFMGNDSGGSVNSITETVTTNFVGGTDSALTQSAPLANGNYVVSLVWSSTEGGTYQVESSTNQSNWTVQKANIPAAIGVSTATNYTSSVSNGTVYVRVTRSALANYDPTGFESGTVAQTNVQSFLIGNDAPTVANPIPNQTNTYSGSFSYTFATNTFADVDSGQTLAYTVNSSVLTNTGISFNSATRTFSATAIDATNGGTIAGTYTVLVIATDNGSPAMSATNSFTFVINKAAASVKANSFTRVYGSTNPIFTGTLSNFLAADSITANYACSAGAGAGVGSGSQITATLNDPGTRLGNYIVTTNNGTLTITSAVLTVTAVSAARSYGATNPVFGVTYSGFVNGQNLASSGVSGSPTLTAAAATNSPVGNYTITNTLGLLSADNYSFVMSNATLTVTQAALTVTVSNAARIYGVTNPVVGGTISNLLNGDNITATYISSATTNSAPGSYAIVPAFSDPNGRLPNYAVTTNSGTLTISKATLLVTANNSARAYGATNPVFSASYSGFANGETSSSGTISGQPALTSAGTNVAIGNYTITNAIGSLASADYSFTFSNGLLTVTQALLTVTPANASRAYGQTNPVFTGTISGIANGDNITANYSTMATAASPWGTYPITVTLNDPSARLANYSVTTNQGVLTILTANGVTNYTATMLVSNSIVQLAITGTTNLTFMDTNSGLAVTVALTLAPYSASNASPSFTYVDTYGFNHSPVHLGIQSGLGGGDGNWVDQFEGENFSASLVSASSGVATNSVQFGIVEMGFRPNSGNPVTWDSSAGTNYFNLPTEAFYALDTGLASLSGTNYSGHVRGTSGTSYQVSDLVNAGELGLVLKATFHIGTVTGSAATLGAPVFAGGQLQFSITGTSGSYYIVQAATNLVSPNWVSVSTNAAPFTFTDANTGSYAQKFYRVLAQ